MTWQIVNLRPLPQGKRLTNKLQQAGYQVIEQPLCAMENNTTKASVQNLLTSQQPSMVIFVSVAAVEWANKAYPLTLWQTSSKIMFIAVGQSTKLAIQACGIKSVLTPTQENSEGLLALPVLQQVADKSIVIVRGDKGRELLAEQLRMRNAQVQYLSSYKKVWRDERTIDFSMLANNKNSQVNTCILVTSIALLEKSLALYSQQQKIECSDNSIYWLVASKRIAERAQQLGLTNIINTQGADDEAILTALARLTQKI